MQKGVFSERKKDLLSLDDFSLQSFVLKKGESLDLSFSASSRYRSLLLFEGRVNLKVRDFREDLNYYQSVLIHKKIQRADVHCLEDATMLLVF